MVAVSDDTALGRGAGGRTCPVSCVTVAVEDLLRLPLLRVLITVASFFFDTVDSKVRLGWLSGELAVLALLVLVIASLLFSEGLDRF